MKRKLGAIILTLLSPAVVFAATYTVCFTDAGLPATGLSPSAVIANVAAPMASVGSPSFTEIVNAPGCYKFTHNASEKQVGFINGGAGLDAIDRLKYSEFTADDANISNLDESVSNVYAKVDTEVGDIKIVTDALPDSGALSSIAQESTSDTAIANIAAVQSYLNTYLNVAVGTRLASTATVGAHASSVSVVNGTIVSGSITDIDNNNQTYLVVQETGGTGKFDIFISATGFTQTYNKVHFLGRYIGNPSHVVEIWLWNYTLSQWDKVNSTDSRIYSTAEDQFLELTISGTPSDYYDGSSPNITSEMKISHSSNAVASHYLYTDMVGWGDMEVIYEFPDNVGIQVIRVLAEDGIVGFAALQAEIAAIPSAATVSDTVWDEAKGDHVALNTMGAILNAASEGSSTSAIAEAVLDEVVEGTYTMRQLLRLISSVLFGESSGGGTTTITFRDLGDSTNRITATVDANGNRTTIVLDED